MNTSLQPISQMTAIKDLEKEIEGKYLTEELLGKFLQVAYPEYEWVHDKKFETPDSIKYNFRPDYCCHELKMSVEFDGPDHFTKANIIQADETKDSILQELRYKVVRIPYFIQLDYFSIKHFFGIDLLFCNCFPHGFVSRNVTLPASFCEQGIWKFKSLIFVLDMYEETGHIFDEIVNSLIAKIHQNAKKVPFEKAVLNVVPSSVAFDLRLKGLNQALINNHKLEITLKYEGGKKVITGLKRVSKPGLRVYVGADEVPQVLNGLGIAILSTSKGIMTGKEAKKAHQGGEVLAYVW